MGDRKQPTPVDRTQGKPDPPPAPPPTRADFTGASWPAGLPGFQTTAVYMVSLPWWAQTIRKAAEAVVTWTTRFETHTRIG